MALSPSEEDPGIGKLRLVAEKTRLPTAGSPRLLLISLYCFQSFPIRGLFALASQADAQVQAIFFKDNLTNRHLAVTDHEISLLKEVVRDFAPDLIGISVLTPYVPTARKVVEALRGVCGAPVIAGGKHPTISPAEALTYADYACKGEGELVLLDALERLRAGTPDLRGIRGLWYRDERGDMVDLGQRKLIQDLDLVPFEAYGEPGMTFIEYDRASSRDPVLDREQVLMMAGRGCVYRCSYCVNSLLIPMNRGNGRFVRIRSPQNVVRQIKERLGRQPDARSISFNDEVFGVFDDWTAEFVELYRSEIGLPFNCELVPKLIREGNVRALASAGLYEMHFGIQSGSDAVRNGILNRPGKNSEMIEKARLLAGIGVQVQCDLILGNPFDTADVMAETIALLDAMPHPLRLNTYKLQFFPHYPLSERAVVAGYVSPAELSEDNVASKTLWDFVFKPAWRLDRKTVLENCVYLIPWNTPLVWWLARRLARAPDPLAAILANLLALWRYRLDFCGDPVLVWIRRAAIVARMIARGDLEPLRRRLRRARCPRTT